MFRFVLVLLVALLFASASFADCALFGGRAGRSGRIGKLFHPFKAVRDRAANRATYSSTTTYSGPAATVPTVGTATVKPMPAVPAAKKS